jgi:uncharacterized phiE125 gp8 family phage protein
MTVDPGPLVVSLAACKAFLRLERDDDDALLGGLIRTATALCEAFTGQWLIVRSGEQRLAVQTGWQRLAMAPVLEIIGVTTAAGPLAADDFETAIAADGSASVRLRALSAATAPPVVTVRAGLGEDWNAIPEALRQGIIRLVAHLYSHRDAIDAGPPPAAIAALWRPWRRLRLI